MIHDRKKQYQSLCKEVANYTFSATDDEPLKSVFETCLACKEINLWTYWHGWESLDEQDDSVHPKILLVFYKSDSVVSKKGSKNQRI